MASLPKEFKNFESFVFDCDGVLLDSNRVKTEAFRTAALPYGNRQADALQDYHIAHGGISRFKKFDYLFEVILGRPPQEGEMDDVLNRFAEAVEVGLLSCATTPAFGDVMSSLPDNAPRLVVSGGEQSELRSIFKQRGLAHHFTQIFGSPDGKEQILNRENSLGTYTLPALYIGDSKYDYIAAQACGLEFAFVYGWTEFHDWKEFFKDKKVMIAENLSSLFKLV